MARFLNTSATNFYLEELIKQAQERLIIISPYLRFNERIKELLEDKDRMKIDVRLVYGKSELAPQEINWLRSLEFVRTSFCQNLHAKCYISELGAIITSMNLYDFSQVNNNEMGVYMERESEPDLYGDTYEEAQRLIRVSEQVRLSAERVEEGSEREIQSDTEKFAKLTSSKIAKSRGIKTPELIEQLVAKGFLVRDGKDVRLTEAGRSAGGERRVSKLHGPYFLWPRDIELEAGTAEDADGDTRSEPVRYKKLTISRLAKSMGEKTSSLQERLVEKGFLHKEGEDFRLTEEGKRAGGERRFSRRFGPFFVWPRDLEV